MEGDDKRQLTELQHPNLLGKIFLTAIGAWLVGRKTNLKVRGSKEQVEAAANAMLASRRFQEELSRPGASVESVMRHLGLKHGTAKQFEQVLGIPWPL